MSLQKTQGRIFWGLLLIVLGVLVLLDQDRSPDQVLDVLDVGYQQDLGECGDEKILYHRGDWPDRR